LGSRLAEQLNHETALVITSTVFFDSGQRAGELAVLAKACGERGVPLLLDAYHHLNIVPFDPSGLDHAYIIGGGYKYCQFGEGNCFLRAPMDCELRPVITGWFADFESLDGAPKATVQYGTSPGARFAGATYDPTSHYRAARVLSFFEDQSLSVERLRSRSQEQLSLLSTGFDALNLPDSLIRRDRNIQIQELAGFLTLKTPRATEFERELLIQGIWTDHRNEALRLGPAPYITDEQLRQAINVLGKVAKSMI
jgi:kynureninase